MSEEIKRCKHGVDLLGFCCKCSYGENSHIDNSEPYRDLTHDIGKAYQGIQRRLRYGFDMLSDEIITDEY